MELGLFQQLSQFDPVLNIVEMGGLIVGMPPQPRRLMATACTKTSINVSSCSVMYPHSYFIEG
jgi:hypothetical protein